MVGAEDLREKRPEDDEGCEEAVPKSEAHLVDGLLDHGGIKEVGKGDLVGSIAEEMDLVADFLAGMLGHGWPPCGSSLVDSYQPCLSHREAIRV